MKISQIVAVDIDGTLTLTDTLHESILTLVRNKPYFIFLLPFWLFKGIAHLKLKVAEYSELNVTTLPYNQPLIDWLKEERLRGKKIVLSTAANKKIAEAVVKNFDFLDEFIASDSITNLKSAYKRDALQKRYGDKGYDYAGNSNDDLEVWAGASKAIVVNASESVISKASTLTSASQIFRSERAGLTVWIKALRVHQWLKNLLLFVPLLATHQISNTQSFAFPHIVNQDLVLISTELNDELALSQLTGFSRTLGFDWISLFNNALYLNKKLSFFC